MQEKRETKDGIQRQHHQNWVKEKTVRDLIDSKRRLVEVPYMASLFHTINSLVANNVVAVPVAAPPGQWIGAGGSMILESDKTTGAVRKHYIGMVTMLDVLHHIAEMDGGDDEAVDLDRRMSVPVANVIGHCLEGLSLWTLNPNTSILDCMEVFSKGIHRALVPLESHMEHVVGVELAESSPGYRMLTQMDVLRFLKEHWMELKDIVSHSVGELGVVNENVFSATQHTKVIEAIKFLRSASANAVPIVEASEVQGQEHKVSDVKGRKLIGTFSATDLKGCPIPLLHSWLSRSVSEFTKEAPIQPGTRFTAADLGHSQSSRMLVTCHMETSLAEVINKAVDGHVHRVWVVDKHGLLVGVISLTDMIRVIRASLLGAE